MPFNLLYKNTQTIRACYEITHVDMVNVCSYNVKIYRYIYHLKMSFSTLAVSRNSQNIKLVALI